MCNPHKRNLICHDLKRCRYQVLAIDGRLLAQISDIEAALTVGRRLLQAGQPPLIVLLQPGLATQYRFRDFIALLAQTDYLPL